MWETKMCWDLDEVRGLLRRRLEGSDPRTARGCSTVGVAHVGWCLLDGGRDGGARRIERERERKRDAVTCDVLRTFTLRFAKDWFLSISFDAFQSKLGSFGNNKNHNVGMDNIGPALRYN